MSFVIYHAYLDDNAEMKNYIIVTLMNHDAFLFVWLTVYNDLSKLKHLTLSHPYLAFISSIHTFNNGLQYTIRTFSIVVSIY